MLSEVSLKRPLTSLDLALHAGRKRQSPRTKFVHLFATDPDASDTIPLYENFCFALALCRMKKAETILEAKELLLKLLPFQTEEGNFPLYLHDFPRCYDYLSALKIAPLLHILLRDFSSVLGSECKEKLEKALSQALSFTLKRKSEKPLSPIWEFRYQLLQSQTPLPLDTTSFSPTDWWEYWIALQLIETPRCHLFHPTLLTYAGPPFEERQAHAEPVPHLLEWAAADALNSFSPRLLKDDPRQIQLAALEKIELAPLSIPSGWNHATFPNCHWIASTTSAPDSPFDQAFRLMWNNSPLHTLVFPKQNLHTTSQQLDDSIQFTIDLPTQFEMARDDLVEVALYCSASPDTTILINGERGTVFSIGDTLNIRSSTLSVDLLFEQGSGDGQFCGHLLFGNRPGQVGSGYEAHDWKIALRTLRRSPECGLRLKFESRSA